HVRRLRGAGGCFQRSGVGVGGWRRLMARAQRARPRPSALVNWLSRPLASFHLILAICGLLITVGVVMVLSASSVNSYRPGEANSVYEMFTRHLISIAVGVIGFYVALRLPIRRIRRAASVSMLVGQIGRA